MLNSQSTSSNNKQIQNLIFQNKKLKSKIQDLQNQIQMRGKAYVQDLIKLNKNRNEKINVTSHLVLHRIDNISINISGKDKGNQFEAEKSLEKNNQSQKYFSQRKKQHKFDIEQSKSIKNNLLILKEQYNNSNQSTIHQRYDNNQQQKSEIITKIYNFICQGIKFMNQMSLKNIKSNKKIIKPLKSQQTIIQLQKQIKLMIAKFQICVSIFKQLSQKLQKPLPIPNKIKMPNSFQKIVNIIDQLELELFNIELIAATKDMQTDKKINQQNSLQNTQREVSIQMDLKQKQSLQYYQELSKRSHITNLGSNSNESNKSKFKNKIKVSYGHNIMFERVETCQRCKQLQNELQEQQKKIEQYYLKLLEDERKQGKLGLQKQLHENKLYYERYLKAILQQKDNIYKNNLDQLQKSHHKNMSIEKLKNQQLSLKILNMERTIVDLNNKIQASIIQSQSFSQISSEEKSQFEYITIQQNNQNNKKIIQFNLPINSDDPHLKRKFIRKIVRNKNSSNQKSNISKNQFAIEKSSTPQKQINVKSFGKQSQITQHSPISHHIYPISIQKKKNFQNHIQNIQKKQPQIKNSQSLKFLLKKFKS